MASEYKKKKLKSKFACWGTLKAKDTRCKGVHFYTPSQRKHEKEQLKEDLEDLEETEDVEN